MLKSQKNKNKLCISKALIARSSKNMFKSGSEHVFAIVWRFSLASLCKIAIPLETNVPVTLYGGTQKTRFFWKILKNGRKNYFSSSIVFVTEKHICSPKIKFLAHLDVFLMHQNCYSSTYIYNKMKQPFTKIVPRSQSNIR